MEFGREKRCLGKDAWKVVLEPSLGRWAGSQQAAQGVPVEKTASVVCGVFVYTDRSIHWAVQTLVAPDFRVSLAGKVKGSLRRWGKSRDPSV